MRTSTIILILGLVLGAASPSLATREPDVDRPALATALERLTEGLENARYLRQVIRLHPMVEAIDYRPSSRIVALPWVVIRLAVVRSDTGPVPAQDLHCLVVDVTEGERQGFPVTILSRPFGPDGTITVHLPVGHRIAVTAAFRDDHGQLELPAIISGWRFEVGEPAQTEYPVALPDGPAERVAPGYLIAPARGATQRSGQAIRLLAEDPGFEPAGVVVQLWDRTRGRQIAERPLGPDGTIQAPELRGLPSGTVVELRPYLARPDEERNLLVEGWIFTTP